VQSQVLTAERDSDRAERFAIMTIYSSMLAIKQQNTKLQVLIAYCIAEIGLA